ncbi:gliding motility-associated C-terminal domain-containing protein [Chitinophaga sp. MM2321]|uniref:T9SS type B sorting domain-containing protein n=1 Tax=Chitinophaga sp. MM2321 TaxID=3137178 RepID=UPI0032D5A358
MAAGTLTATATPQITASGSGTSHLILTGPIADMNTFITAGNLMYLPVADTSGTLPLNVLLNDNGGPANDTPKTATASIALVVSPVNDAPAIGNIPAQSTGQDVPLHFNTANSNLISISDVDAGTGTISITLTATNGKITLITTANLTFVSGSGTLDRSVTVRGKLADINTALADFVFTPDPNFAGAATLKIAVNDQGNTPAPPMSDDLTIPVTVSASSPLITNVSATSANGAYGIGKVIPVTVTFDQPVVVNTTGGTPALLLETGATDRTAVYSSGSNTNTITFSYTVQAGDVAADLDYVNTGSLTLNGGTIQSTWVKDATVTLPAAGSAKALAGNKDLVIDGVVPVITKVTVPANKTYKANENLEFNVLFSESVDVTDVPFIPVTIGATVVSASYQAGTGSNTLTFRYTVKDGELDTDGIALAASLNLNGGTIRDAVENDAVPALVDVAPTSAVLVDAVAPVVTSVAVPADGVHKAGDQLDYTVSLNENVDVDATGGDPSITLVVGSTTRTLNYVSGTGTTVLLFRYTVQSGDLDADGVQCGAAMVLNGSTIKDAAGNPATLTLNNVGAQTNIKVDAVLPVVTAGQVFTIAENSPVATVAGTVAATDAGAVLPLQQYTITTNVNPDGDADPAFSINPVTGALTVNDAGDLNYEANPSFDISVTVSDGVNTSAVQTVHITLTNVPEAPTDITLSNNAVFENNAVNAVIGALSATSVEPGEAITYTLAAGAGSTDNTAFNIAGSNLRATQAFNFETQTTYNIRIRATAPAGEFFEKAFVITVRDVNEAPTINAIADQSFCVVTTTQTIALSGITAGPETAQTTTVTATSDNAALFTTLTADDEGVQFRFAAGATGTANITVTVKDGGGTDNGGVNQSSQTFKLAVTSVAEPTITSNMGTKVSKGLPVELTAAGGVTYAWDNAPDIVSGQNSATVVIRPQANATYRVTASNAAGCTATGQIDIEVIDDYKVDGVNLITPNGDGINDRFIIKNIDSYPNNEVKIFDRSGRMIYTKRGYQNEWGGTLNGTALEEGTYYYILDFGTGLPKVKGFITIIRDK